MDHVVLSGSRTAAHPADPCGALVPGATTTLKPLIVVVAAGPAGFEALRAVLGQHFRLKEYASGEQAWASLQIDGDAGAIVCSNALPRMSGLELVAKLRKARLPTLRTIPVCLLAETVDDDLRSRIGREQVDFLGAWDRPLVDLAAWLRHRLAPGQPAASRRSRADALRHWAHRHAALARARRFALAVRTLVHRRRNQPLP